jgi:hypothetical protein
MPAADEELRALRRDLLLARAAAERAQIALQLERLGARTRSVRGVAGTLFAGGTAGSPLGLMARTVGFVRRQPWILPAAVKLVTAVVRSRTARWVLLGAAAAAVWWIAHQPTATAEADSDSPPDTDG